MIQAASTWRRLPELWVEGPPARECRGTAEYGSASEESRFVGGSISIVTNERNGADAYLPLSLNGRRIYGLLDTGCDTSVASRRVIPNELLKLITEIIRRQRNRDSPGGRSGAHFYVC